MLFSSSSKGRSLPYHLPTALYLLLPSLLTHLFCMELGQQCCTACIPFPPYRWTAEHPHRYSSNNTYIVRPKVAYKRVFFSMWFLCSRAQPRLTLSSLRSPRSLCRAESTWPWRRTTPCSRPPPLKQRPMQGRLHSCPSCQSSPPWWRTRGCAAASATPHCRETWTSPQDWLRSRSISQTLCCLSSEERHFESSNAPLLTDIWKEPYDSVIIAHLDSE